MPEGYPYPEHFDNTHTYYEMTKLDIMGDLENKLIIDWPSPIVWAQWAKNDKEVYQLLAEKKFHFQDMKLLFLSIVS